MPHEHIHSLSFIVFPAFIPHSLLFLVLHYIITAHIFLTLRVNSFPPVIGIFRIRQISGSKARNKIIYRGKKITRVLMFITSPSSTLTSLFISSLSVLPGIAVNKCISPASILLNFLLSTSNNRIYIEEKMPVRFAFGISLVYIS